MSDTATQIQRMIEEKAQRLHIDTSSMTRAMHELRAHRDQMTAARAAKAVESHMSDAFEYGVATAQASPAPARGPRRKPTPWQKLASRMEWDDRPPQPLKVQLEQDGGYVFCMAVVNGEAVVLKDDEHIWPSDQTVTQLRMLANG